MLTVSFFLHVSFETKGQQQQKIKSPAVPFSEVFCLIFNGASGFGQTTNYTLTSAQKTPLAPRPRVCCGLVLSGSPCVMPGFPTSHSVLRVSNCPKEKASFKTSSFLSKMHLFPGSSCPTPDVSATLPGFQAHPVCVFQPSQQVSNPSFISAEGLPDIQS